MSMPRFKTGIMIRITRFKVRSKPGYPYHNAVTEVFFKYLKQGEINRRTYHSIQEVQLSCFEYIEQFYNNYNPHSANNGLTPNQKEENYFKKI